MSTRAALHAALDYLGRGWSVIPVRTREKRPLIAWQDYQRVRASSAPVRIRFARWPEANVGIVTGAVSQPVVVDVDPEHDGDASITNLVHRHGPLAATVEAISGGGGRLCISAIPAGSYATGWHSRRASTCAAMGV